MVGIVSNSSSLFAQTNLERANAESQTSIARISSGSRIISASDDVAGLAVGTVLRTNVSTLKTVLTSTSQAVSLLSTADGGLSNIDQILSRQKALAVQANSGTLSANERAFLNEEFQNLVSEIDRLVENTNFNGSGLLNGSIFDQASLTTDSGTGQAATGYVSFNGATIAAGKVVTIGGVTFTSVAAGAATTNVQFNIGVGGDIEDTIDNLVAKLNASTDTNVSQATYTRSGDVLYVEHDSAGQQGNAVTVVTDFANATATATLSDGAEGSLTTGRTDYQGTLGDTILVDLQGTYAAGSTTFSTATADLVANAETFIWDSGNVNTAGGLTFTFRDATNYATNQTSTDVLLGDNLEETIDNLVAKLNAYEGNGTDGAEDVNIFDFKRIDNVLHYTAKTYGTAVGGQTYTAVTTAGTIANDSATAVTTGIARNDAANDIGGLDVTNVTNNEGFVGNIQGFQAIYTGSTNSVDASITVGGITYEAVAINTDPVVSGSSQLVRFSSGDQGGGYFDIIMRADNGETVNSQADADTFAARLDAAFSELTFNQTRDIGNFNASGDIITNGSKTGTLNGATMEITLNDFSAVNIESVTVTAPVTSAPDASVEIVVNGEIFRSEAGIGKTIGNIDLISTTNPTNVIRFNAGAGGSAGGQITVSTDGEAKSLEDALSKALGVGEGESGLNFQVGIDASDSIGVALESAATSSIYKDNDGVAQTLDILTAESAQTASDVIDNAIKSIVTLRATVGALQSRFDFAAANIESSIQNTEAARSDFLDADIAEESTNFATSQVRLQASISVLAQANQLPQNLLKLIG